MVSLSSKRKEVPAMFQNQMMTPGNTKGMINAATVDIFKSLVPVKDTQAGMAYVDPQGIKTRHGEI